MKLFFIFLLVVRVSCFFADAQMYKLTGDGINIGVQQIQDSIYISIESSEYDFFPRKPTCHYTMVDSSYQSISIGFVNFDPNHYNESNLICMNKEKK